LLSFAFGAASTLGAAIAAMGVIKIEKDSKQATNTLRLPGVGSGNEIFTAVILTSDD
jgi:hypothetical protein